MVTTAALALAAAPRGVTMSPMSAFFVSTTASKGARTRVYSTFTLAASRAASEAFTADSAPETPAAAFRKRASAASKEAFVVYSRVRSPFSRS